MISSAMTAMPRALVEGRVRVGVGARVRVRVGSEFGLGLALENLETPLTRLLVQPDLIDRDR